MNITPFGNHSNSNEQLLDNSANDFIVDGKHARMSQRKVASITLVSVATVNNYFAVQLNDVSTRETLANKGVDGVQLKQFVTYLALDAKRISKEVRNHNIKLLSDASDYGFQALIDKMAGIGEEITAKEVKPHLELTPILITSTIDLIFVGVNIKPEIVAGVKCNAIKKEYPQLGSAIDGAISVLRENTASKPKLMTPTELGKHLNLSGQKINKLLIETGLQVKNENKKSRKDSTYIPTDKGSEFCSYTLSTGKTGDNTTYQQLLWYESVLDVIS